MNEGAASTYAIDGEFSIYRAAELAPALAAWAQTVPAHSVVNVDLSDVSEMDSAGLQLLLSLERTLAQRGATLLIGAASEPVREVLALGQCLHWLAQPAMQESAA